MKHLKSASHEDRPDIRLFALIGRGQMGDLIAKILQKSAQAQILVLHSRSTNAEWNECKRADILIDFSHASAVMRVCEWACRFKKPLILGTTGWDDREKSVKKLVLDSQIPCLHSPNFSWGIYALRKALMQIANLTPLFPILDVALRETHGKCKADAPSGTAKQLARDAVKLFALKDIDIESQRLGVCPGEHILTLDGQEEIVELRHMAKSRRCFAHGAIAASQWLLHQGPGWYTMDDMAEQINAQNRKV